MIDQANFNSKEIKVKTVPIRVRNVGLGAVAILHPATLTCLTLKSGEHVDVVVGKRVVEP